MTTLLTLLAELTALGERATPGPWSGCRLVHADRHDSMTPDEVGEYVKNSVIKSETERRYGAI